MFGANSVTDVVLRGSALSAVAIVWVVILVRLVGLRSFSKMTNFDFVMTIATGSLLAGAGQAKSAAEFGQALIAMAALFAVQVVAATLRRRSDCFESVVQNTPLILMKDGVVIEEALGMSRVARSDLFAKLREANVLHLSEVRAVVLETTGDISVLHGDTLEAKLLEGTRSVAG